MERVFKRVRAHGVIPAPLGGGDYRVRATRYPPSSTIKLNKMSFFLLSQHVV